MTSANKPTVEQILRRKFAAQSGAHFKWAEAKKRVGKTVDTGVFKKNLGGSLDALSQIYAGAKEVQRYYPKLDDRTTKPVQARIAKVDAIQKEYVKICKREATKAGITAAEKKAWADLDTALSIVDADVITVRTWLRKVS